MEEHTNIFLSAVSMVFVVYLIQVKLMLLMICIKCSTQYLQERYEQSGDSYSDSSEFWKEQKMHEWESRTIAVSSEDQKSL